MAKLDFYIEGQKALSRNLRILADGVTDMKVAFSSIGKIIEKSSKSNFEQQGSE